MQYFCRTILIIFQDMKLIYLCKEKLLIVEFVKNILFNTYLLHFEETWRLNILLKYEKQNLKIIFGTIFPCFQLFAISRQQLKDFLSFRFYWFLSPYFLGTTAYSSLLQWIPVEMLGWGASTKSWWGKRVDPEIVVKSRSIFINKVIHGYLKTK